MNTSARRGITTGCCGLALPNRVSISDLIERGYRRRRHPPEGVIGGWQEDEEGRRVRFSLAVENGLVRAVGFEAPSCTTLVAYCEIVAERLVGLEPAAAVRCSGPAELAGLLPQVPLYKRALARLASSGVLSALSRALQGEPA